MKTVKIMRKHLIIQGAVQGVGFRPFIFRLAHDLKLQGWIVNSPAGVELEIQGPSSQVLSFLEQLPKQVPPLALIRNIQVDEIKALSGSDTETAFVIRPSKHGGGISALLLPDMGTCKDCLDDMFRVEDRRYHYPFTNCTNCGPRYSIIEKLPYDRPFTSMKHFPMCPECIKEYENPLNRRFHAQPNACPVCGPHMALWDRNGQELLGKAQAISECVKRLKEGCIIAIKGIGGFQLMADASNSKTIQLLRKRKGRMAKPFAMMAANCETIEKHIALSDFERHWLKTPQAPIVLIEKKSSKTTGIAPEVSGQTPTLGFMLPYSPLHHLLMRQFGGCLVATSGNLSEEPICIDEHDAVERLGNIADYFLVHNRPIVRPVDDSVMRIVAGKEMLVRRARGFAPFPIESPAVIPNRLAVGAHLKNTIALSKKGSIFISQHIGDLESLRTRDCFEKTIEDLSQMYQFKSEAYISDLHPDYASSRYIQGKKNTHQLQHHYTHILSCMADHQLDQKVLGVAWDGTGLGPDGTVWGGEFFICDRSSWERIACVRPFFLPGGDLAAKEPRRVAMSLLSECMSEGTYEPPGFSEEEIQILNVILKKKINCMETTSAGRLFDGFAALLHLCNINHHEGEAPQALELCASLAKEGEALRFELKKTGELHFLDWGPIVKTLYRNRSQWTDRQMQRRYAAGLHDAMAHGILEIARLTGQSAVCLSGGCFQNRLLSELTKSVLEKEGFQVFLHHQVPPNDGGLSAGQLYYNG